MQVQPINTSGIDLGCAPFMSLSHYLVMKRRFQSEFEGLRCFVVLLVPFPTPALLACSLHAPGTGGRNRKHLDIWCLWMCHPRGTWATSKLGSCSPEGSGWWLMTGLLLLLSRDSCSNTSSTYLPHKLKCREECVNQQMHHLINTLTSDPSAHETILS